MLGSLGACIIALTLLSSTLVVGDKAYFYRLGDMVKGVKFRSGHGGMNYHFQAFPSSIASEYMRRTNDESNLDVLHEIIDERVTDELIPAQDELVLHLRVGDVIDDTPYSVGEFLSSWHLYRNGYNYVRPLSYFKGLMPQIERLQIKKITMVAGVHYPGDISKSLLYLEAIENFFRLEGLQVSRRFNLDADDDFIFMSKASFFAVSSGGYSKLISDLVVKQNNQVLWGHDSD